MNRERKPPISISEVKNGGKPEPQKGSLSYVEKPSSGDDGPPTRSKGKVNYTQLVIAVGLSVLAFLIISNFTLASKSDALALLDNQILLEGKQIGLEGSIASTQSGLATESQRIENLISTQATYDSQLSGISGTLGTLGGKITGAESAIASLKIRVTELEDAELEYPIVNSLDYYLTRSPGGYKLHVTSSVSGIFISRITLVYTTPYSIAGASINEAMKTFRDEIGDDRDFVGSFRWTGSEWEVLSISFYTGGFSLDAGEKDIFNVSFEGPEGGYVAYVEVLPGTVVTSNGEDNEI